MRIISGKFKGRRFNPPIKKWPTRPTMDAAKEALFNVLSNEFDFGKLQILELFGGTGNISLEFISRGCTQLIYVDSHRGCVRFMHEIAAELQIKDAIKIYKRESLKFIRQTKEKFDIIFCDPPYRYKLLAELPLHIFSKDILFKNGVLIIEHDREHDFSSHSQFDQVRKYGTSHFSFFRS